MTDIPEWFYRGLGGGFLIVGSVAIVYYLLFPPVLDNFYELIAKYVIPLGLIYFGSYAVRGKDIPPISR